MAERIATLQASNNKHTNMHYHGTVTGVEKAGAAAGRTPHKKYEVLDFYQLFEAFTNELGAVLPYDGIQYTGEISHSSLMPGTDNLSSCAYHLEYGQQDLGCITIVRDTEFMPHERKLVEDMLADLILPLHHALQHQKLIQQAQYDQLTGIRNGSYCYDLIDLEIHRARRYKRPFSLLMFDIDDFSKINNQYGHSAGDALLVEVAARIQSGIRSSDTVYRYAGDKFLVFLPDADREEAMDAAQRVRECVIASACVVKDKEIVFTMSAGVTTSACNDTVNRIFDRTGKALFHAKILGKNRIYSAPWSGSRQAC